MSQFFKNKLFLLLILSLAFVSGFLLRGRTINQPKPKYLERLNKAETWAKEHHNGVWLDEWK